jgi:hypothetical protein|tara:strand:- start:246 stop:422 length:177 start_codon:yes stop_codon:yes gene_type:complete
MTSLVNFYATCADIVGAEQKATDEVESISLYPTLIGPAKVERDAIVMHSIVGMFAIRL